MRPIWVFDLDDTLYLERDFVRSGFRAVGADVFEQTGVPGFADHCLELFERGERRQVFDRAVADFDLADEISPSDLVATYRNHRPMIRLAPDAQHFLSRINLRACGLITDGHAVTQRNKIAALGLADRLGAICVTGEWGAEYYKPNPRAFSTVENQLARHSRNFVYIADNAAKDFVAPRALGWRTVQIIRDERIHCNDAADEKHGADVIVTSFAQLGAALEA